MNQSLPLSLFLYSALFSLTLGRLPVPLFRGRFLKCAGTRVVVLHAWPLQLQSRRALGGPKVCAPAAEGHEPALRTGTVATFTCARMRVRVPVCMCLYLAPSPSTFHLSPATYHFPPSCPFHYQVNIVGYKPPRARAAAYVELLRHVHRVCICVCVGRMEGCVCGSTLAGLRRDVAAAHTRMEGAALARVRQTGTPTRIESFVVPSLQVRTCAAARCGQGVAVPRRRHGCYGPRLRPGFAGPICAQGPVLAAAVKRLVSSKV